MVGVKSQLWSIDILIGIVIFLATILVFYQYSVMQIDKGTAGESLLQSDAEKLSNFVVSTGHAPITGAVVFSNASLGLTDGDNNILPEQLNSYANMSYSDAKKALSIKRDFNISIQDTNGNPFYVDGVYSIGKSHSDQTPDELVKVTRIVHYNSSILHLVVFVW